MVALGSAPSRVYQGQMKACALAQAGVEAVAIADAGIRPVLGDHDLSARIGADHRPHLMTTTQPLLESGTVRRLRDATGMVRPRMLDADSQALCRQHRDDRLRPLRHSRADNRWAVPTDNRRAQTMA